MCDDGHHHHGPPDRPVTHEVDRRLTDVAPRLSIPLEPVDAVRITTLADAVSDLTLTDLGPAKRPSLGTIGRTPTDWYVEGATVDWPLGQPGFSALVEIDHGGRTHRVLFDAGVTPDGVVDNMGRLGLDPGDVEVIVLSHGHFDHTAGLAGLARRLGRTALPVVIHPAFWRRRRIVVPGREPVELPTTSRAALGEAGFEVVEERMPKLLFERCLLVTGEVDRTTPYEKGMAVQEALVGDRWEPDPLILDDQALVLHVRGRGLVVLTGCGHAGVVNLTRYARRLTGVDEVHALMGGFHLNGPLFEPVIPDVTAALTELAPDVLVPAHCTGPRAQRALAQALPDAFVPNSVGTRIELPAA